MGFDATSVEPQTGLTTSFNYFLFAWSYVGSLLHGPRNRHHACTTSAELHLKVSKRRYPFHDRIRNRVFFSHHGVKELDGLGHITSGESCWASGRTIAGWTWLCMGAYDTGARSGVWGIRTRCALDMRARDGQDRTLKPARTGQVTALLFFVLLPTSYRKNWVSSDGWWCMTLCCGGHGLSGTGQVIGSHPRIVSHTKLFEE